MKNHALFFVFVFFFISCSGGDEKGAGGTTNPTQNQPPSTVSSLIAPENNLLCTSNYITFEWAAATDPEGEAVKYVLEISTDNSFSAIAQSITTLLTKKRVTLDKGTYYYWRVKAIDPDGASSPYSSVFSLYTEGEGVTNHLPFQPQVVSPQQDSFVAAGNITLSWTATDLDNDPLAYDVYFSTANPPTEKVAEDIDQTSLAVSTEAATTYFWRVVVKDSESGFANGQVWTFNTN